MKIALLLSLLGLGFVQQDAPTATFTEPFLGFQFNHPKTWTVVKPKRKDPARTVFSIPIDGTVDKAELDVVRTDYHASIDLWQTIQLRANEQLHRTVTRQWTQEILGVSMLFSRIDYTERGTPMSAVLGLYYTRTPFKMLMRLTSPTADFDKVFYDYGKTLETLRQLDGKLPQEDDPNITLAVPGKKPEKAPVKPHVIDAGNTGPKVILKAPVTVDVVVSTRKVTLRAPLGWYSENIKGSALDLHEPSLSVPLHIEFYSVLDSDTPIIALTKLSATQLNSFTKVATREDTNPNFNKAGCTVSAVWRLGQGANGDLATCEAAVSKGDYYCLITYSQPDRLKYKADRKLIEDLLKQVGIESAE